MKEFGFQWHITNFCNLRCRHCYQDDFSAAADLDTGTVKGIVRKICDTLADRRIYINLTGGEPFLRKDLFDILETLETFPQIREYNIITNALPLDRKKAERLETFRHLKQLKISLECSDSELNDSIRGRGSFRKILQNLELLKELSSKTKVLMYTLGGYNYHRVPDMLEFSRSAGADAAILERFVPLGQGQGLKESYLKADEWRSVIQDLIRFCGLDSTPEDLLPYKAFYVDLKNRREVHGALCNLGDESMALMPNGDVYPCRRLPVKIGNVLKDEFSEIILRLQLLRESLDKDVKGKCGGCRIESCYGCRAIAYSLTSDMYAEDPQCFLAR
jgi:radical SAM protein with 4Fe4S-binding SPASM domain